MATISLCMIVRDEEEVLEECLAQVKDLADEIIIVDTGSKDRTKEIAARIADRVEDFVWQDDFAAARNAAFALARCDFCMWLDADDVITEKERKKFLKVKESLDLDIDVVVMDYAAGFGPDGRPNFIYPRERLIRNGRGYRWEGRVHETIAIQGRVLRSSVVIEHRKKKVNDPDRNLRIYEAMAARGEEMDARSRLYYGRELYQHRRYEEAEALLISVLRDREAWKEYRIEASLNAACCASFLGKPEEALELLFASFSADLPRAEICCEAGRIWMEKGDYSSAAYWFEEALRSPEPREEGGFVREECRGYIPWLQLCVCWDRLGDYERAQWCNEKAGEIYPESPQVEYNREYFRGIMPIQEASQEPVFLEKYARKDSESVL